MIGKFLAGTLSILFISLANADSWNDFLLQSLEKQVRAEVEGFLPTPLPKGGVISRKEYIQSIKTIDNTTV